MKKTFLLKTMLLLCALVVGSSSVWADYEELYSADFTTVENHSYTQNKTFTLSEKSWKASVSQVNASVFYLGCNSNNAAKGILNNNTDFSDIVSALAAADATYNTNKTTAHAYALLFNNAYNNVTKVSFDWIGTNNLFQVYLFGDSGTGWVKLANVEAANGASESGSLTWTGSATNYTKFAIVARPGASNSTATSKTLRASTFKIYKTNSGPSIATTETSLTDFTYLVGNGPSAAKSFSVSGSNLTGNISLSLGESSNYEMSLTENSGYTDVLSLTPTTGTVAATDIYVRLKSGLAANASYEGTITLTSTDATDKTVSLAGSVTQPIFTWNLATNSYSAASEDQVTWTDTHATMVVDKASSTTKANNYLGGDANNRTSSRFYSDQILTIAPTSSYAIASIEFTATSNGYATTLEGSTWTNATTEVNNTTVTVTPINRAAAISATIGGTCGFTFVKVYWENVPATINIPVTNYGLATFASDYNLDYSSVTGLEAYIAKEQTQGDNTVIALQQVNKVPAGTGVLLRATDGGGKNYAVPVATGDIDAMTDNLFVRGTGAAVASQADSKYNYILNVVDNEVGFYRANNQTVATNRAYLQTTINAPSDESRIELTFDGQTGIATVNRETTTNNRYFDLQGRPVAQPTKGLYIVNGKKVLVK